MAEQLTGVAETLLIPLKVQWQDNLRVRPILPDPKVADIVARLDLVEAFDKFAPMPLLRGLVLLRKLVIDRLVRSEVAALPAGAMVVNLGCGLCTRFDRLDDGRVVWLEVDQASVAPVWQAAFAGAPSRRRFIAADLDDDRLVEALALPSGCRPLFILEGVSMYLSEARMRGLATRLATHYPGAVLIFDAISNLAALATAWAPTIRVTGAQVTWGLDRVPRLAEWGDGFAVVKDLALVSAGRQVYGLLSWVLRLNPFLRTGYRVIALRLGRRR